MNDVNGSELAADLRTEESAVRVALGSMIQRMTPNVALRDDLRQEAMLHMWLTETRRPGQTQSWYLQSCRFHLQHYLRSGKSIDSARHWRNQSQLDDCDDDEGPNEPRDSGDSVVTTVSAREIVSLLKPRLSIPEQAVLDCLAEGLQPREIGRKLKLSHTMVIRHRQKIASLFTRLEVSPHVNGARQVREM